MHQTKKVRALPAHEIEISSLNVVKSVHCQCDLLAVHQLQRLPRTGQRTKLIYSSETIYSSEANETETEPEDMSVYILSLLSQIMSWYNNKATGNICYN